MNKVSAFSLVLVIFILTRCSSVPLTGRKQLAMLPESEMITMGLASYQEFMKENPVSTDKVNAAIVSEVGKNLTTAVETFLKSNGLESRLDGYAWEFSLVASDLPNAFCIPGGKVVIYSGIIPFTAGRNGLAVVISHEIAHAVARHGNERMSQQMLVQLGGIALSEAIKGKPDETRSIYNTVYGIGIQVGVLLPYSREHEYEADKLGLIFMAMAGYDPQSAIVFWEKMSSAGGAKPPEFLSTHPSDAARIEAIRKSLPEAMRYYKTR
jgi:predicted Zn-dependent protease